MSQKSPLFSVIVTSYNYEDYICNTLDSLVNQTFHDFEVIVVDDGSTDNSWQIIREYADHYSNIKAFSHQNRQNKGIAETMKLALSYAKGEYIAFLESDDYWSTCHLAETAAYLESHHRETKLLVNGITALNNNYFINSYLNDCATKLTDNHGKNIFNIMKIGNIIPTFSAVTVQRKLLESCDFNSPHKPWLDYWLWLQVCFYHPVEFLPEPLTCWRQHSDSYNSRNLTTDKDRERFIRYGCDFIWKKIVRNGYQDAIKPAFPKNNIAVALASDNNYAPYLGVLISSILKNSSPENNYDLIILESRISDYYKTQIKSLAERHPNVSIRFADIANLAGLKEDLLKVCLHFSMETYYRFFIVNLCENYDKMMYLDCDMIVQSDIAELYKTELGKNLLAATHDYEMVRVMNSEKNAEVKWFFDYARNILKLKQPYDYMQSGVMMMNVRQLKEENVQEQLFFKLFEVGTPKLVDQDIFNAVCQGRVLFFSPDWNFEWQLNWRDDLKENLSEKYYQDVIKVAENPKIIHYCDCKPWKYPHLKLAHIWWQYARETPFYEEVIFRHMVQPQVVEKTQPMDFSVMRDLVNYSKNRLKYWRYILFSNLAVGKKRQKYRKKRQDMRARLKQAHALLKGKEWLLAEGIGFDKAA